MNQTIQYTLYLYKGNDMIPESVEERSKRDKVSIGYP